MFSDSTHNDLHTRISYVADSGVATADIAGLRGVILSIAVAIPTEKALNAWARQVLGTDWFVSDGVAVPCHPRLSAKKVPVTSVCVVHRRVVYDAVARGYRSCVVREVNVSALT